MRELTGGDVERGRILERVLGSIDRAAALYARHGFAAFGSEYAARCRLWGQRVNVEGIEGTMYGVDGTGALTIRHDDGTTSVVASGHVQLVTPR
jgi:biotin-(acetyl-CoA carboxylase) ligase